jgi:DNA-directed RNA polymerase subunit H (RpoH/RPB5)
MNENNMTISTFKLDRLQTNITRHQFQPQFHVCTKEEKRMYLELHGVKEYQIPKIYHHDPICEYYGVRKGTLLRTYRKRPNGIDEIGYRIVI